MSEIKTRKWLKVKEFRGLPKREDFEIAEEVLPPLKDGGKIVIHNSSLNCTGIL